MKRPRIDTTPQDTDATEVLRDDHSGTIVQAPVGSVKKGVRLVTIGAGKSTPCGMCHGADLRGRGPVPGLVGRSPSYLVRQLQDMQPGTRKRIWTDPMRAVAGELTDEELIAIGADLASTKR